MEYAVEIRFEEELQRAYQSEIEMMSIRGDLAKKTNKYFRLAKIFKVSLAVVYPVALLIFGKVKTVLGSDAISIGEIFLIGLILFGGIIWLRRSLLFKIALKYELIKAYLSREDLIRDGEYHLDIKRKSNGKNQKTDSVNQVDSGDAT
ncbi:hypothetical protein ACFL6I_16845 [candidate division KSB1 bacterium]